MSSILPRPLRAATALAQLREGNARFRSNVFFEVPASLETPHAAA